MDTVICPQKGIECNDEAEAPDGWAKWIIPGYEYIYVERDSEDSCSIKYLKDNGISLVGAVHDFISLGGALREVNEELGIILNPKDGQRISRICREQTRDLYDVWVFYNDVDISDITL